MSAFRPVHSGFTYPHMPIPKEAVNKMEKPTRIIIHRSSDFMIKPP